MEKKKIISSLLFAAKMLVFVSMLWTAMVMYRQGNQLAGFMILIVVAIYIIFNKLNQLEE